MGRLNLPQIGVSGRGLAFLKGSVGVYMIDEVRGGSAPSRDAMTTQAQTVLGRLLRRDVAGLGRGRGRMCP